jgi:hypothetical protein
MSLLECRKDSAPMKQAFRACSLKRAVQRQDFGWFRFYCAALRPVGQRIFGPPN